MKLTTADLDGYDEVARKVGIGGNLVQLSPRDVDALVRYARLQVAIDELPLPEGWDLWAITRQRSSWHGDRFKATVGTEEGWPDGAGIENKLWAYGPTMLDAVLALDAELRKR